MRGCVGATRNSVQDKKDERLQKQSLQRGETMQKCKMSEQKKQKNKVKHLCTLGWKRKPLF